MGKQQRADGAKVFASNRQAFHNFFIDERYEAGIVLLGTEVKSIRAGRVNLKEGYARLDGREIVLFSCNISPYSHGGYSNHDPLRPRKLLLHKQEIQRIRQKTRSGGATLIPLRMYLARGHVKVEIALARGKKLWDKRESIRGREQDREARAALRGRRGS